MGRRAITAVVVTALALALGLAASPATAQGGPEPGCVGDTEADGVAQQPGPLLRFGIGPLVQAGQVGPAPAEAVPERPAVTDSALARLRPPGGAFVLRLNRFFWSDREAGIRRYLALAERFTSRGYLVELQVRYRPDAEQEGDIAAWTEHVREVVRRFGANPRVVALQIANEVNLTFSPDSSDGAFAGAREALVRGVIAAKDEARRRGHEHWRSASTGPTAPTRRTRRASGARCATAAAPRSSTPSIGSGSTPIRARSSRRPSRTSTAIATGWSTP